MLNPASPPPPKAARTVRLLDHKDDECDETLPVAPLDPAKLIPTKEPPVNSKAASIRALLRDHPDGLGYDGLCKGTGIARDRIVAHLANLLTAGDIKGYELPGRGRVFKITGGGVDKVAERKPNQTPTVNHKAAAPEQHASSREDTARAAPSTAADRKPADESNSPATGSSSDSAATSSVAPQASESARPEPVPSISGGGSARATDHQPVVPQASAPVRPETASSPVLPPARATDPETEAPQAEEAARPSVGSFPLPGRSAANPARASVPDDAHAVSVELVCIAAKNAIAELRSAFGDRELRRTWPELADAIDNFQRADLIYLATKGRA